MTDRIDSWRAWLDQHGPALLLFARQSCGSRTDAEDAVQNGFIKFWKSRSRARDDDAYLFACVRSAAIDISRSESRRRRRENALASTDSSSLFQSDLHHREQQQHIESALASLPDEQREVLVLKIWAGLTFSQIAETLATSPNTIASRYRYALQRLESQLSPEVAHE